MNNSIKREQSQACLSFAERENQRSAAGGKANFRPQVKRKLLSLLVLLLTAVTGAWAQSYDNTVNINEYGGDVSVPDDKHWLITGTGAVTTNKIIIGENATVTLSGVNIKTTNDTGSGNNPNYSCIQCKSWSNATIILADGTTNTLTSTGKWCAAIQVGAESTLTIQGSGSLKATGGQYGAGIGCNGSTTCGNIVIQGGNITATGSQYGAGIGAGNFGSCGNITISGGNITAKGGTNAAGIGATIIGHCGNITISGGAVDAKGGEGAAGIGGGNADYGNEIGYCGDITITENVTIVTANKGTYNSYSIGKGTNSTCGTVTIGSTNYPDGIEASPYTYPEIIASGNCGTSDHEDEVTWKLTGAGVLIVSGTGAMENFDYDAAPWKNYKTSITSDVIGDGVTTIGSNAFYGCANLASVNIPASLTTIGYSAFEGCSTLATVNIPASVTRIGGTAFSGCNNLTSITLNSHPFIDYDVFPSGATVTMNLTTNPAAGAYWTTFYDLNYSFQADANTQVFKVELSGVELTMHEVEDRIVNAGIAVVLKSKDANPVMTRTDPSESTDEYDLKGVSDPDGQTFYGSTYVLNYTAANGVGFYELESGVTIDYGKAYLFYSGTLAREFFGFDEATGIESVSLNDDENVEVYDLQGRRVSQPAKGLYIVRSAEGRLQGKNGKKVIIK